MDRVNGVVTNDFALRCSRKRATQLDTIVNR